MIILCANELDGTTGYHKSVVETANGLHRAGYPIALLSFLGPADGADRALPLWTLDVNIPAFVLHTLPAEGGRLLHRNLHPVFSGQVGAQRFALTANQLAALRQLCDAMSPADTMIFTNPLQAVMVEHALADHERHFRTVLQIHGDYRHHVELWESLRATRNTIDRLQTVAEGLRSQFIQLFDAADIVHIPNFPGSGPAIDLVEHKGIDIALPATFQHRKNQLAAVHAMALIPDEAVRLTLWGTANPLNPYFAAVRRLVDSLGLNDRVRMPGFGTEAEVYATADIVLMTSLSEGFGYPLIEAAHHGRPAIAFDFDYGPREAIEDGRSGFVVPLGDVEAVATRLRALAADPELRKSFGQRSREVFVERYSTEAITQAFRDFLGPAGSGLDIARLFTTDSDEPVATTDITHGARRIGGQRHYEVVVASGVSLYDVEIDNGSRITTPSIQRVPGETRIAFRAEGHDVISYALEPGSPDRHYLADTEGATGLNVLPYLRRGASYGDGPTGLSGTLFAASSGASRLTARQLGSASIELAADAFGGVGEKLRQFVGSARPIVATGEREESHAAPASHGMLNGALRASDLVVRSLPSLGRTAAAGMTAAVTQWVAARGAPSRRELPRHPWFPVTSGVDGFGVPINHPDGVTVRNSGSLRHPTVTIEGAYESLLLRDGSGERHLSPPFSYGELFDAVCTAEREHGLFEITTADGVHVWELGRAAVIYQLAEAAGLWDRGDFASSPVNDAYKGDKRLTTAPPAHRVVFDYIRRGQSGYRTAAFRDESLFVVQPGADGYPEVDDDELVYPIHEFNRWRQDWRRRWSQMRTPEVDARPFEQALTEALGIRIDLGSQLRSRLRKFMDERDFWTPVFERVRPDEVLIASSHWWAGVNVAARRAGAAVSDIQYAMTSHYAPTYWFGGTPHYGATRFYAWSEYWAARTNAYEEHFVVPRQQPELTSAADDEAEPLWDVCVVSQPRVQRQLIAFIHRLAAERPELRIVLAPHPDERGVIADRLGGAGLRGKVTVAPSDTLTTIRKSAMCAGVFSTSLWEAASLGRPTFVIPAPGYEETLQDISSRLFRLAESPDDLVPYDVPESRHALFPDAP